MRAQLPLDSVLPGQRFLKPPIVRQLVMFVLRIPVGRKRYLFTCSPVKLSVTSNQRKDIIEAPILPAIRTSREWPMSEPKSPLNILPIALDRKSVV